MSSWSDILDEVNLQGDIGHFLNEKRALYLTEIHRKTGRNIVAYYSAWLRGSQHLTEHLYVNDTDKNAFMQAIYNMDKTKGLDLILHTPGGDIAATESIIDYLHSIFCGNIRAIIPQIAMSAGTMMALSCKSIMMGKQSNLGPVDPQISGIACGAVLAEFEKAKKDVIKNPSSMGLWQAIIAKYNPTFLIECKNAQDWSYELVKKYLDKNPQKEKIISAFTDHSHSLSHSRHFSIEKCKEVGLNIEDMEKDHELQDLILSLHHCFMIFFDRIPAEKVVENHQRKSYIHFRTDFPRS